MSELRIHLERLELSLHGVPAAAGQALAGELERCLRERLAAAAPLLGGAGDLDLGALRLQPIRAEAGLSGAGLAALVAERLVDAVALRAAGREEGTHVQ